jgi:hypothetical protein
MKEYAIYYRLNGETDYHYVSVSSVNLPFEEIKASIIHEVKKDLQIGHDDDFKIISIQENN